MSGDDIDWLAVDWVVTERLRLPLNGPERREVIRRLGKRLNARELSDLLGVTMRTIERDKTELRAEQKQLIAS